MIPLVFHFVWLDPHAPDNDSKPHVDFSGSWAAHHPKSKSFTWTRQDVERLLADRHPGLRPAYDKLQRCTWLQSLLARAAVLHTYGGIYVDHDVECTKPLLPLMAPGTSCIVTGNPEPYFGDNVVRWSFLAAERGHPVFADVLRRMSALAKRHKAVKRGSSGSGRAVFQTLQKAIDTHAHTVTLLDNKALVDFDAQLPLLGHYTIGIYRAPRTHRYENWVHATSRRLACWGKENPTASKVLTYFVLGLMTGVVINLLVYFIKRGLDRRLDAP